MINSRPSFGQFFLILAFGMLCGLAVAGAMVDCNASVVAHDAGCLCP
jgi:hypothetical protein